MSGEDYSRDPQFRRWAARVRNEVVPMIRGSTITASLFPSSGEPDIKYAVELGLSILMDKPIVLIVAPANEHLVNDHLRRVCDEIIVADLTDPRESAEIADRIQRISDSYGSPNPGNAS
jgi:hypothetical protein